MFTYQAPSVNIDLPTESEAAPEPVEVAGLSEHLEVPIDGSERVVEALRQLRQSHRATVEEVDEEDVDDSPLGNGGGWGLREEAVDDCEPGDGDFEEVDAEGLEAYERLGEAFEREVEEAGMFSFVEPGLPSITGNMLILKYSSRQPQ